MKNMNQKVIEAVAKVIKATDKVVFEKDINGKENKNTAKLLRRAEQLFDVLKETSPAIGAISFERQFFWCKDTFFSDLMASAMEISSNETWINTREDRMEENLLVAGTVLADLVVSTAKGKLLTQEQFEDCMSVVFFAIVHRQLFLNAEELKEKENQ
nr:MAG TPA: hypothetical protein [Caudoviricetes sp.]